MFINKKRVREIFERLASLEYDNYKLTKRVEELEIHLPEEEKSDTPSCKQILDEWLGGKERPCR